MSIMFEQISIGNIDLKNHFVMSATGNHTADLSGHITDSQIEQYFEYALGGVGMIITGAIYVHPFGMINKTQNPLASDDCIPRYKKLTSKVHETGTKIIAQLMHGGIGSMKCLSENGTGKALAPSALSDELLSRLERFTFPEQNAYREATESDILQVISQFGDAAGRAREAGFDGIQIHAAHGTLHCQFLSPLVNRRDDRWGGSLGNRLCFHEEVYNDIRKKTGSNFPVLVKLGLEDGFSGGLTFGEEGKKAVQAYMDWGVDIVEPSQGIRGKWYEETEFKTKFETGGKEEGYYQPWCRELKDIEHNAKLILTGGLRTCMTIEKMILRSDADLIGLCRPLIREYDLIRKWEKDPEYKPKCISCNKCLENLLAGKGLHCIFNK